MCVCVVLPCLNSRIEHDFRSKEHHLKSNSSVQKKQENLHAWGSLTEVDPTLGKVITEVDVVCRVGEHQHHWHMFIDDENFPPFI